MKQNVLAAKTFFISFQTWFCVKMKHENML